MITTSEKKKALIAAAFAHVYGDEFEFARVIAQEHAIVNMGQRLEDLICPSNLSFLEKDPSRVVPHCFNSFYQGSESDEQAECIQDEYKDWLKDAKKQVTAIRKKKLPLTLENARLAFENKGPFEKKKVKTVE